MKKHHITNTKEADVFFYCRGAVGFFDSHFPVEKVEDAPKIYRRNYFDINDRMVGYFIPLLWQNSAVSVKVCKNIAPWGKHPKLTRLEVDLQHQLEKRGEYAKR